MIVAPNATITKKVIGSDALFAALALIYGYLTVVSFGNPAILEGARPGPTRPHPWACCAVTRTRAVRCRCAPTRTPADPHILPCSFVVYFRCSSLPAGGSPGFSSGGSQDLNALAKAFSYPETVAVGWAHFIAQDLLVGRFIWVDGVENKARSTAAGPPAHPLPCIRRPSHTHLQRAAIGFAPRGEARAPLVVRPSVQLADRCSAQVFTPHSLLLTLFFGPLGVLSHLVTRAVLGKSEGDVLRLDAEEEK